MSPKPTFHASNMLTIVGAMPNRRWSRCRADVPGACGYRGRRPCRLLRKYSACHRCAQLDEQRLIKQLDEIDCLNDELDDILVLKSSSEVDILADGSPDLPNSILKRLDLTVCAVHYKFDLDAKAQTERVLRAMDDRYCNIVAHPTGRLLGERPGYPIDLGRVMEAAKERGCFLELNAHPGRLDLDDIHCKQAKDIALKVAISTDAHSTAGLNAMRFGIGQARRGWLEAKDVLNTRPWPELKKLFSR